MQPTIIKRHYPITTLEFRDFWDICSRFQRVHPNFNSVHYTVEGHQSIILLEEPNVSNVLKRLKQNKEEVLKYSARFYSNRGPRVSDASTFAELQYRPAVQGRKETGLTFYSDCVSKATYYQFEEEIYSNYPFTDDEEVQVEFGKPCEVLALVIDIRGFSVFCEKPEIESPYTCGLMSAFYNMVNHTLQRYPPEMTKFLGDGVLAIWETSAKDREIVVHEALKAALSLRQGWSMVKNSAHFTHGAPQDIGAGICFGLASHLEVGNDYIGRPINIASRLCGACPGDRIYVDRAVPNLPLEIKKQEYLAHIKPYGRHNVWAYSTKPNRA
ncbi:MAG: adenylate/guanylate cyclase domain-containing protein [Puniceicoccaceae bacterium]|nr:MAG: adenylate/guanylate cyclase domain-containing protein [Puniceicoccaceae bacterium]